MEGMPVCQLAQRLTTSSVSEVSLKTLYRWEHRFQEFWGKWWVDQRKKWASEFQEGESFLSLCREEIPF
ncbi:UNVERIFIED_ORG: hypothetical protein ABRZ91_002338 [Heyndrickxia coagulans]